jgi:chromosome segregation ATPase
MASSVTLQLTAEQVQKLELAVDDSLITLTPEQIRQVMDAMPKPDEPAVTAAPTDERIDARIDMLAKEMAALTSEVIVARTALADTKNNVQKLQKTSKATQLSLELAQAHLKEQADVIKDQRNQIRQLAACVVKLQNEQQSTNNTLTDHRDVITNHKHVIDDLTSPYYRKPWRY